MGINIIKCTSTANTTSCNRTPEYLVLHYTAGTSSKVGSATSIAKYFAKPTTKASADYIVDDGSIVQYNPDPKKYYCWAVGGSKYTKTSTTQGGKFYGKAKNANCVSIEICSNKKNTKTLNASDTDWYFTDAELDNAVELSKHIMELYNIPIEKVIMHHHVTGKICPNPWCVNEAALIGFEKFKKRLQSTEVKPKDANTNAAASTDTKYYRVQVGAYKKIESANMMAKKLKSAGFDAIIKNSSDFIRVQVGAYSKKSNAEDTLNKLKKKGFDGFITYS